MAIGARTRSGLMWAAWTVLCLCGAMYIGLQVGRPLYYTDGQREVAGGELHAAGMLRWRAPEAAFELPERITGRVARLPDGRLLFGRLGDDGTSDLFTWHPQRPDVPPEPAYGLNSAANELAPAVGPDGRVYFASDRAESIGGYDLFVSTWTPRGFGSVTALTACNTALDETDPARAPRGSELVFVRIDRRIDRGNDGVLFRFDLDGALDPAPLFPELLRARERVIDRDPVFHPDGASLWFVRKQFGRPLAVCRSSRMGERFDEPLSLSSGWATSNLRSPLPAADGQRVAFVQAQPGDDAPLLYESLAEELVPWWPGQHWLEWLLLSLMLCAAALLLLLHFGRRWSALDLVAQCLLLSLLLHVLLFLWLMGVEIAGSMLPGDDDDGGMQVSVVTSAATTSASERSGGAGDVAARVQYTPRERAFEVAAPGSSTARASAMSASSLAVENGAFASAAQRDEARDADAAALSDQAEAMPVRSGADAAAALQGAELARVAQTARSAEHAMARSVDAAAGDQRPVEVHVPAGGGALPAAQALVQVGNAAPAQALPMRSQPASASRPGAVAMQDAAAIATPVANADAGPSALQHAGESAAPSTPQAASIADPQRAQADATHSERVAAPASGVQRSVAAAIEVAAAGSAADMMPTVPTGAATSRPSAPALRDAASTQPNGSAIAAAGHDTAAEAVERAADNATPAQPKAAAIDGPQRAASRRDAETVRAADVSDPGSGLARADGQPVAAGPARRQLPVARPGSFSAPKPQLRGAVAAGASAAPTSRERADERGAVAAAAVSSPDAPVRADTAAAASRARAGLPRPRDERVALPGSALGRTTGAVAAGQSASRPLPSARARTSRPIAALRGPGVDAPRAATTNAPVADAAAPSRGSLAAAALALPRAPLAAAVLAPRRASGSRRLGRSVETFAVTPPGSAVPRAAPRSSALPQNAAPQLAKTAYSNRFGPAKAQALERFGGSDATERAVRDGLRYLAGIQNRNGSWGDNRDFDGKYGFVYVGKTALCVLAFLGGGHTPTSNTEHSAVVRRALDHLLSLQDDDTGAFGRSSCYGHGITTYALAECYGMTKHTAEGKALLRPLEDALTWILANQGPRRDRRNRGGWGYFSPGLRAEDRYARVSVSAWMIMALESARLSGVELPEEVLSNAREYLELSYDRPNGWFRYNHEPSRLRSGWPTLPASTPAGAFCLMLLGKDPTDEMVTTAVDYTADRRPQRYRRYSDDDFVLRGQGNVYFWYYGSLCCFLAGGEAWQRWNARLSTVLPAAQAEDGSFPPIDVYSQEAGDDDRDRSYTTAMCVLSLEVYYRYFTPLLLGR